MITLYHCVSARSFRPLWTLEELGLPYQLTMLPFPPRALARAFLQENPLGTVPLLGEGVTPTLKRLNADSPRLPKTTAVGFWPACARWMPPCRATPFCVPTALPPPTWRWATPYCWHSI